jgi:hypothetical protein
MIELGRVILALRATGLVAMFAFVMIRFLAG